MSRKKSHARKEIALSMRVDTVKTVRKEIVDIPRVKALPNQVYSSLSIDAYLKLLDRGLLKSK